MPLRLNGSTSGYVELAASAIAGNVSLTLPSTAGAVVVNGANSALVNGTAQNSVSGTSIDFTGIPSWVKRVTVMFNAVSTNGTSFVQVQLGTSSGIHTTSYNCSFTSITGTNVCGVGSNASGAVVAGGNASVSRIGSIVFAAQFTNTWSFTGITADNTTSAMTNCSGIVALTGTLDRVRITTLNGTDTFDNGLINIMYE